MACDRFVYWKKERRPKREELRLMLEDFFAGLTTSIVWEKDRFFINILGAPSSPFKRFPGVPEHVAKGDPDITERWIEVWPSNDCLDVMTRQMDEVTNVLAEGFAKLAARYWDGELEA